ncbi:unnamed protein product [Mycena citricolor]|uniref:Hydrophobic surface binding protein n=1 Tax=Mycena citricolor TaxID=2018698 RepID=A0AAD2K0K7_9AGAR|nr:unnamed protein product [Mycena citricolor]
MSRRSPKRSRGASRGPSPAWQRSKWTKTATRLLIILFRCRWGCPARKNIPAGTGKRKDSRNTCCALCGINAAGRGSWESSSSSLTLLCLTRSSPAAMVQFTRALFIFGLAAAVLANPTPTIKKRTVAAVESDIATISSQVNTLDTDVKAFPTSGGTLLQALTIHSAATTLGTTLTKSNTDAAGLTFSESDASTILSSVQAFEPTILDALSGIVARKAAFNALPVGGIPALVLQDLKNLNASTIAFANALIAAAPADIKATATALEQSIASPFASAIAAYS